MPFPWLLVLLVTLDVLDFQLHRSSLSFCCLPVCSHVSSLERTPVIFDCVVFKLLQPCPTLCSPMDCSPPGSSVHGILLARILKWVAIPSSRESSQPRDRTQVSQVSCIGRQVLYHQGNLRSQFSYYTRDESYYLGGLNWMIPGTLEGFRYKFTSFFNSPISPPPFPQSSALSLSQLLPPHLPLLSVISP